MLLSGWRQTPLRAPGERPRLVFDFDSPSPVGAGRLMPMRRKRTPTPLDTAKFWNPTLEDRQRAALGRCRGRTGGT